MSGGTHLTLEERERERERLAAEMERLNASLAGVEVGGAELAGWTRSFNEGDRDGFAWDRGGRLHAQPGGSYQVLGKERRRALTLDGEPVVEIDIVASHLTLAYAQKGRRSPA